MSTFLQVSGVLFWLSLGAGGLWVGLCLSVDWWKSRRRPAHRIKGLEDVTEVDLMLMSPREWAMTQACAERRIQELGARDV